MDVWNEQRNVITDKENKDLTTLGFATFFLNRTNRSGIITGGVIGGKKQDGKYLMDARYNKEDLATRIHNIGKMRDR
ncbi:DNA adenine methylase, partial [Pseudomonas aeruginosa]